MGTPGFRKLTYMQAKRVEEILHQHCKLRDGFAYYDSGFDDARIAQIVRATHPDIEFCTNGHVANLRKVAIGPQAPTASADKRLEQLQSQIDTLSEAIIQGGTGYKYVSELGSRVTKLEARLKRLSDALGERYDD